MIHFSVDSGRDVVSGSSHLKGDLGPAQGLQWDDLLVNGIWPGEAFFVTGLERHCPQASIWPAGPTQHVGYWSPGLLNSWAGKQVISRDTGPYFL